MYALTLVDSHGVGAASRPSSRGSGNPFEVNHAVCLILSFVVVIFKVLVLVLKFNTDQSTEMAVLNPIQVYAD
jgi:hypothetical protein